MRDQLTSYVELLFAGSTGCEDMKLEILQNTLERYDDLVAQGKQPEAAYRLAISGIGDISELLGDQKAPEPSPAAPAPAARKQSLSAFGRILRGVAIMLYIISPIPLFILSELGMDTIGLCGLLALVGLATALMVIAGASKKKEPAQSPEKREEKQEDPLYKALSALVTTLGIIAYFILSFATGAWFITWVIFPLIGTVNGLIRAILDLRREVRA